MNAKQTIEAGKAVLGIEFGSTRIKAVLIDQENNTLPRKGMRRANDIGQAKPQRSIGWFNCIIFFPSR